jgi:PiT family inorganic phosphate transporter
LSALVLLGLIAIAQAYAFEAVNGFHDTAHACATSVASGVFGTRKYRVFGRELETRYWIPVLLSGMFNFLGALTAGTAVAMFIPKIVAADAISMRLVMSALLGGVIWNVWTWKRGIPVSSTHCLIGSLVGAGIAASGIHGVSAYQFWWAVASLFCSPFIGYLASMIIARILVALIGAPGSGNAGEHVLRYAQVASSCAVSYGHGSNDGQKTMGIITLILSVAFGYSLKDGVPFWVIASCAGCMALGTIFGAGRIIHTVGEKLSTEKISFHDGFSAELVTAALVLWGSRLGLPLSTTQVCTGSVLGAGRGVHQRDTMNWKTGLTMVAAWFATFVATGVASLIVYTVLTWLHIG